MALSDAAAYAVAAWDLDEASGTRVDQVGSNDLTDNNTVASAAGMFGNAGDFETGNSEYLSHTDNATLSVTDQDFGLRCWVKLESKAATMAIASHWGADANNRCWLLHYHSGNDRFQFMIRDSNNDTRALVLADNFGSPSTGVWYLLHAWHDTTSNNEAGLAINAGTANTSGFTGGVGITDSTATFTIGASDDNTANFFDGLVDDFVFMKDRFLTSAERTEDYNGGTGKAFSTWAAAGAAKIFLPSLLAVA